MAQLYYVTSSGNDTTGDGSIGNPWASVQKGVDSLALLVGPQTLSIGTGLTNGNSKLSLDATNNNQDITIVGVTGATMDNKNSTPATTDAIIDVASGCNAGVFRFQGIGLNCTHSTTSYVVKMANANATDVQFEFSSCDLDSSHRGVGHIAAGTASYTFTACTIEAASGGAFYANNSDATLVLDSTTVNADQAGTDVIDTTANDLSVLTIRNGSILHSPTGNYKIIDTSVVGIITLTDSTFIQHNTGSEMIICYGGTTTTVTGCTFTDAGGLLGSQKNLISLRNGSSSCTFSNNTVTGISPSATTEQFAVKIFSTVSGGSITADNNTIATGCGGIYCPFPSASGCPGGSASNNSVTIVSNANSALSDGINIGGSSETPTQDWGDWAVNYNSITHTGTNAGIGIRMSVACQGTGTEVSYNTILNQKTFSTGAQYGFYFQAHNAHVHHNNVYSRNAMAMISSNNNLAEFNNFVSPTQGDKGVYTLNYHAGIGNPTDTIVRQNIICALFDSDGDFALDVEGTPSGIFVDKNYYGVADRSLVELNRINGVGESTNLAESQANWNSLGGASVGSDLNSVLGISGVFVDPENGNFAIKTSVIPSILSLGFPIGATMVNPLYGSHVGISMGIGI